MVMLDYAIFIQARLGSTRFPKKTIHELAGKRVLDHVIDSCAETKLPVFLLTPESDSEFFKSNFEIEVFGGSEEDVLDRFYSCAIKNNVKNIVRITSDCPGLPSSHISAVVEEHKKYPEIFVTNVAYDNGYDSMTLIPDGFDVEIFSFDILEKAHLASTDKQDREHVTKWMRKNVEVHIPRLSLSINGKFSLDTIDDLTQLEKLLPLLRSSKTLRL